METFQDQTDPLTEEEKFKRLHGMNRDPGKFVEVIDEYNFKYVMDLFEMWSDGTKDGGFNWWIYEVYDEGCTDELGLLYDIEKIDKHNNLY